MLDQVAHYNDLSPALRRKLEEKIASFGKKVSYRFNISHENPDPDKYNGKVIWPSAYTLDPIVFDIVDSEEKRESKSRAKKIGIVSKTDEKGIPEAFERIRVFGKDEGILVLDLEKPEDIQKAAILELHPKLEGGLYQDANRVPIVFRIDEQKEAKAKRESRNAKSKALQLASEMSDVEIKDFAAAMNWDERTDIEVLRDMVENEAENNPKMFNDLAESDKLSFRTITKKALTAKVISYDPMGGRILWASNQQVITVLGLGVLF